MTENEIYGKALKKLYEHLENDDMGFDMQVASYFLGVIDVIRIIKERQTLEDSEVEE